jgi:hypothetical protein
MDMDYVVRVKHASEVPSNPTLEGLHLYLIGT